MRNPTEIVTDPVEKWSGAQSSVFRMYRVLANDQRGLPLV